MTRTFVFMVATVVVTAVCASLPVLFGMSAWPITPGAVIVAYAAITAPPLEAAVAAALVGLVADALSGAPIGVSSFSLVVTLLVSRLATSLVQEPRGFASFAFVGGFASGHALLAQMMLALFGQRRAVDLLIVIIVGVFDAVLSVLLFPILHRVLVLLRLEDRGATLGERLSTLKPLQK